MNLSSDTAQRIILSEADVVRLLEDKSPDSRAEISGRIADSYSGSRLGEKERQIAEQIFRLLVRDTEVRVRASLSEKLKASDIIPRDIVMTMARDIDEVSLPVLESSKVLSDEDLLDIIAVTQENSKFLAISKRDSVSEAVSGGLVAKGNDKVVGSLMNNSGAKISEEIYAKIVEIHKENPAVIEAVAAKGSLPVKVSEKLVNSVSSGIAEKLKQKHVLPEVTVQVAVQKEVDNVREAETLNLVRSADSHDDVEKLIRHLQDSGRLTPSMILSALCQGNFDFFESSLALLSGIKVDNARTLIADRGELGFRAIYNKSGLPDAMFPAVKLLLRIVRELDSEGERPGSSYYANRIVERILHHSEEEPVENLSYIIALVRRVAQ